MKIGIIFGGISTEHDVSIVSATSILKNINKEKYEIYPIYIANDGLWYEFLDDLDTIEIYKIGMHPKNIKQINGIFDYLKKMDVLFPVLHGKNGEDGTIQGLFTMLNKPYVGCKVLSSSVCMDKVYTKIILDSANILQAPSIYLKKDNNKIYHISKTFDKYLLNDNYLDSVVKESFGYPVFVKPSNSGSSVGVTKANNLDELNESIAEAFKYDNKLLIEKCIVGKEVECAILGGDIASNVGEVLSAEDFYTFDAKYTNAASKTQIPADIPNDLNEKIKEIAKRAFLAVDGSGLSRVDFFIEDETNNVYLNEINTLPGFTEISMYPKLIEELGISYTELIDKLIELAKLS